jgi:hypothetical protein
MLDPRIYRAAFVPVLLAILVVAFSLEARPRAIGTTLAPDAFDGAAAFSTLQGYARRFPVRRPGDPDDRRLADEVARGLEVLGPGTVRTVRTREQTVDGERELSTVVARAPAGPGPVSSSSPTATLRAPRPRRSCRAPPRWSSSRASAAGRLRRTITFVSTSGGSGGMAGARAAAERLVPRPVDAVLVLGRPGLAQGCASRGSSGWSNGRGARPCGCAARSRRACAARPARRPGGPRARAQWARLAFPGTVSEQGAFARRGWAAVLLSVSGRATARRARPVDEGRLTPSAARAAHDLRARQRPGRRGGPRGAAGHPAQGPAVLGPCGC